MLRATIKQSQHDFTNALTDLDLALRRDPGNAQAWLTKATVLTVQGNYAGARRACLPLIQLTPGLIGLTAAATVGCLNGAAAGSCALLSRALEGQPNASAGDKLWALTVLAETSARLGRLPTAEAYFKSALALGEADPYLLGAYADLLLDEGRNREVIQLLAGQLNADALLLRLTLAEDALSPPPDGHAAHLGEGGGRDSQADIGSLGCVQQIEGDAGQGAGDGVGCGRWPGQLDLPLQREPADVRILLETARAAGDAAAAQPALDFLRDTHLEDVQLDQIARKITLASAQ